MPGKPAAGGEPCGCPRGQQVGRSAGNAPRHPVRIGECHHVSQRIDDAAARLPRPGALPPPGLPPGDALQPPDLLAPPARPGIAPGAQRGQEAPEVRARCAPIPGHERDCLRRGPDPDCGRPVQQRPCQPWIGGDPGQGAAEGGGEAVVVDGAEVPQHLERVRERPRRGWVRQGEPTAARRTPARQHECRAGQVRDRDLRQRVGGRGGVGALVVAADHCAGTEPGRAAGPLICGGLGDRDGDQPGHAPCGVAAGFAGEPGVHHQADVRHRE